MELLHVQDLSPLIELANQDPLVLEIFKYTWLNASMIPAEIQAVRENIDKIVPSLVVVFKGTDGVTFLSVLGDLIPKIEPEVTFLPSFPIIILFLTNSRPSQETLNGSSLWSCS